MSTLIVIDSEFLLSLLQILGSNSCAFPVHCTQEFLKLVVK